MPENNNKLGILIFIAITAIIGLALFSSVTDSVSKNTRIYPVSNESVTISSGTGTLVNKNLSANPTYFGNSSLDLTSAIGTGSNFTLATGAIKTNESDRTYNVSYNYYPSNYVYDGTSRVLIGLLNVFYALGILAVVLLGMYKLGVFDMFKK